MNKEDIDKLFRRIELDKSSDSCGFEFADGSNCTFDNIATCYDDRLKLYNLLKSQQTENQQLKQENQQLKSILEEIREYLDEFIIYVDEDGEVYFKEEFKTGYNDLLQIIDKSIKKED